MSTTSSPPAQGGELVIQYRQAPHLHIENAVLEKFDTIDFGAGPQVSFNYKMKIHARVFIDACIKAIDYTIINAGETLETAQGYRWVPASPSSASFPFFCVQHDQFGFSYSGSRPAGTYDLYIRITDSLGQVAWVVAPYTL